MRGIHGGVVLSCVLGLLIAMIAPAFAQNVRINSRDRLFGGGNVTRIAVDNNGRGNNANVRVQARGNGANVFVANNGVRHGGNVNAFVANGNKVVIANNGFGSTHGFGHVNTLTFVPASTSFGVRFVPATASQRFNAFGTRTVVDQFGNVFEQDAFGNSVLRSRAASYLPPTGFAVPFSTGGFGAFNVCTPGGFCH